jgi:hypothetical protein
MPPKSRSFTIAAAAAVLTMVATAQEPASLLPDVGQLMQANQEALQRFTHKRRTTISFKDKSRSRVDQVRYVEGKVEAVPVDGSGRAPGANGKRRRGGGGPLVQRRIEKKRDEMREEAEQLAALLHQYLPPPKGLFGKAKLQQPPSGGLIEIAATGVVKPKDSFRFQWNSSEKRPQNLEIRTDLDGKPVSISVTFARLPHDGPFHASSATLSHPKKNLTVRIDNYDFQPDPPPAN